MRRLCFCQVQGRCELSIFFYHKLLVPRPFRLSFLNRWVFLLLLFCTIVVSDRATGGDGPLFGRENRGNPCLSTNGKHGPCSEALINPQKLLSIIERKSVGELLERLNTNPNVETVSAQSSSLAWLKIIFIFQVMSAVRNRPRPNTCMLAHISAYFATQFIHVYMAYLATKGILE